MEKERNKGGNEQKGSEEDKKVKIKMKMRSKKVN